MNSDGPKTIRATISFRIDVYRELELIAETKKVSLAWVVREATEKYVADQWPLFSAVQKISGDASETGGTEQVNAASRVVT